MLSLSGIVALCAAWAGWRSWREQQRQAGVGAFLLALVTMVLAVVLAPFGR
jgi:formate hydrogenlyase subunit 3/multisubunit Na+/H+ antiporter MnhD subunit